MMKSEHKHTISSDIPVSELSNFINPVKMSLYINKRNISGVFSDWGVIQDYLYKVYDDIFSLIPSFPKDEIKTFVNNNGGISYVPHTTGYDFRFSPIDFFNNLFKYLAIHYEIPFINLDNVDGKDYLIDYVSAYTSDYKLKYMNVDNPSYCLNIKIIDDLNKNIKNIIAMYDISLESLVEEHVIPKDMLLYLAYKSLENYEKTEDEVYLILPYEYYVHILPMKNSPYPHSLYVGSNHIWYPDFDNKYNSLMNPGFLILDDDYLLTDNELLLAWDILKPGELERKLRDTCAKNRVKPNVDYDKYLALFEKKMNFYLQSPYIKYIKGKYGLNGYLGFSYSNEYLLFDKFHNSETIDPSKKTILTHGEAVFALPSDRFSVVRGTKQDIIKAKETDERIIKVNHTNTFIPRLDNIIHGPNVSTTTFEKVIEEEKIKGRMLIRKTN